MVLNMCESFFNLGGIMGIFTMASIGVGLAMDAFAVSICQGLKMIKVNKKYAVIIALFFGVFQVMMPLIGYVIGVQFESYITSIDHWIAFILLGFIGFNMIKESREKEEIDECIYRLDYKELTMMAIATSIDALAVGVAFAFLNVNVLMAVSIIGIITFGLSLIGVLLGHTLGMKFKSNAEMFGGIVLIIIGLKILLEHLNII